MQAKKTKINNNNNNKRKPIAKRKPRRTKVRLPNNRGMRANIIRGRKIAAASAAQFSKKFNVLRQNGSTVRVTGRDLIYSIPDDMTAPIQTTNVITVIPANPAYWIGTRISALAAGYQNYRPLLFKITYVPTCAVTQPGNVIGGTIWDDGFNNSNIQQSLRTSNGGFLTQCYVPHTTRIRPKTNLQFNLYKIGGEFDTNSNPFIFIAIAIGCKNSENQRIVPGYFYVTWSFELKNPVGNNNSYFNSGLTTYTSLVPKMNNTIVNIDTTSAIPFGAYIDVEEGDTLQPMYNGTPIEIQSTTPVWIFQSVNKAVTETRQRREIYYTLTSTATVQLTKSEPYTLIVNDEENGKYIVYRTTYNIADNEAIQATPSAFDTDLLFGTLNNDQNFGKYIGTETKMLDIKRGSQTIIGERISFLKFEADKQEYILELQTQQEKQVKKANILIKPKKPNNQEE